MLGLDGIAYWATLLIPVFFWGAYHHYKDRHRPEPILMLVLASTLGYCSAYLAMIMYTTLDYFGLRYDAFELAESSRLGLFWYAVLAIGPIEELAKFIPFSLILIRLPHFDEPLDGVIYASFIALGFSLHENEQYLQYLESGEAVARSIASPMIHVLFASIWGYAYGYANIHKLNRVVATILGLVVSMVLHGVFDFFSIGVSAWTSVAPPLIILAIWLWRMFMIRHPHSHHRTLK